jgi:prepilin-type N-terminal cleavage/methylation domain-containing protein
VTTPAAARFTLVEMLVALVLSAMLMAAVITVLAAAWRGTARILNTATASARA